MLPQTTTIVLIVIEGTGVLISIGFAFAAYKAYKKSKAASDAAKKKAAQFVKETEAYLARLRTIAEA